jgi:hypothetical protein
VEVEVALMVVIHKVQEALAEEVLEEVQVLTMQEQELPTLVAVVVGAAILHKDLVLLVVQES